MNPVMKPDDVPPAQQLRSAGLRATAQRGAVLDRLAGHPHASVDEVGAGVSARLGSISRQAVDDVLGACVDAGLVRRIEPAGHPARFERRTGGGHRRLDCRDCGAVEDVDCASDDRPCLWPDTDLGFMVDEAEVVLWGSCTSCLRGAAVLS
jgi:Fur family transcriptional regulator, stress-responsive regulator